MVMTVRGRVRSGRLLVDEPMELPDDTEVELAVVVDEGDDLDSEQRARLHADLLQAMAEVDRGEDVPMDQVLAELHTMSTR